MALPLIEVVGAPREQGRAHGEQLRERVRHNIGVYFRRFADDVLIPRVDVLAMAKTYLAAIDDHAPDYAAGMRGIAEGAGVDLAEIAALNVRYEILYYKFGTRETPDAGPLTAENRAADGCTAFAVSPAHSATGTLLLGQNWDWIPEVKGALVRTIHADGFKSLAFTEAGIFGGKIGLNSAGIGLAINGMTSTTDDWAALHKPFHVRCFEILRQREFGDARAIVTGSPRACTANFLIAQTPAHVVNIEAAPHAAHEWGWHEAGCFVHTNHILDPARAGISEPPNPMRWFSKFRHQRFSDLLGAKRPVGIADLQQFLADRENAPFSVSRQSTAEFDLRDQYETVTAIIMDLHAGRMWATDGPPHTNPFAEFSLHG